MRSITIEARSLQSAQALYSALSSFLPELTGDDETGFRITVPLGTREQQILEILDAIEQHVTDRNAGPARVELEGRHYTMHPAPAATH